MSSFTTPLDARMSKDGMHWKLLAEFTYEIGVLGSNLFIHVPAGFITDFASTPRILWRVLPPYGEYGKAAVLHDWLYAAQQTTKLEADNLFLEAMEALGVGAFKRWIVYQGVRVGGGFAWREHQKRLDPQTILAGKLPEFPNLVFN